jgi:hypothetical protein
MIEPFRIAPTMPPQMYKTHTLAQPLRTHWRRATCAEVDCPRYLNGWKSVLDMTGQDGQNAAAWIRSMSGLHFTESATGPSELTFLFPAGQMCARADRHRLPLGRDPLMLVRGGDHRGNPSGLKHLFGRAEDWRDDLGEHLDVLREQKQRG